MAETRYKRSQEEHTTRIAAARQKASEANQRTSNTSIEVGKEKTQYFEKIALGTGATIAAIVSFVGSSPASIHSPLLVKLALVLLVIGLAAAMYRNWRYPFYTMSVWLRAEAEAKLQVEHCEYELFDDHPDIQIIEDGLLVPHDLWKHKYEQQRMQSTETITAAIKRENRIFLEIQTVENAALILIILAIVLLTALIWVNVGLVGHR